LPGNSAFAVIPTFILYAGLQTGGHGCGAPAVPSRPRSPGDQRRSPGSRPVPWSGEAPIMPVWGGLRRGRAYLPSWLPGLWWWARQAGPAARPGPRAERWPAG